MKWKILIDTLLSIPYPLDCNPNPRVLCFKMGFWVEVNSKNPSKSGGGLFKKNPKNRTFHINWGFIQEWGVNHADKVSISTKIRTFLTANPAD